MAIFPSTAIPSAAEDYEIGHSLRCDYTNSHNLSRTPSSGGNRKTWTFSTWFKLGSRAGGYILSASGDATNSSTYIYTTADVMRIERYNGDGSYAWRCGVGSRVFRDPSAWYHLVVIFNSADSTEGDRIKAYINGELETNSFIAGSSDATAIPLNYDTDVNDTNATRLFGYWSNGSDAWDGYMAETHFVDGAAVAVSTFGKSGDYGEWKPIEVSGVTYGTNGFYLDFADSGALGDDESGNTNDFTANNLAAADQMLDTPTNNFAVMNPLRKDCGSAYREGNLYLRDSGSIMGVSTILPETGKWYWEVDPQDRYAGSPQYGIATETINNETEVGGTLDGVKIVAYSGGNDISLHGTGTLHGSTGPWPSDHIWGFALDNDNGKLWISRDGDWTHVLAGGNPSTATNPTASGLPTGYPIFGNIGSDSTTYNAYIRVNFGADGTFFGNQTSGGEADGNGYGDFKYAVPTGFLALCTKNLPEPAVKPSEHFNTVLYTGDGSTQAITGVGFQSDFTWIKSRETGSDPHQLYDAIRGATESLKSDATDAEITRSTGLTAFGADGFTVGNNVYHNRNTSPYVAWNWKAGNATLGTGDFTQGSIASTCSRNVDAGFSIVSYTGNVTAGATVGHGLSKAPEMIITKSRAGTTGWLVGHSGLPDWTYSLALSTTGAAWSENPIWNSTAPSATLFTLGSDTFGNSADTRIAYCFHSVDGYSKCGSYTGNGNADGTFVYTGFRPAFLLVKESTDAGERWFMFDNKRDTFNYVDTRLAADDTLVESTGASQAIDFLSNGFKARANQDAFNTDAKNYIYLAFAETPQKYANAR